MRAEPVRRAPFAPKLGEPKSRAPPNVGSSAQHANCNMQECGVATFVEEVFDLAERLVPCVDRALLDVACQSHCGPGNFAQGVRQSVAEVKLMRDRQQCSERSRPFASDASRSCSFARAACETVFSIELEMCSMCSLCSETRPARSLKISFTSPTVCSTCEIIRSRSAVAAAASRACAARCCFVACCFRSSSSSPPRSSSAADGSSAPHEPSPPSRITPPYDLLLDLGCPQHEVTEIVGDLIVALCGLRLKLYGVSAAEGPFRELLAEVDVSWHGRIERVVFALPEFASSLTVVAKQKFETTVDLTSTETRMRELFNQGHAIMKEATYLHAISKQSDW